MNGRIFLALVAGVLFGAGLTLSGMTDPTRVRAFLDLFWAWDPTLAFVMGGALLPMTVAWAIVRRRDAPIAADRFDLPEMSGINTRLVVGAGLFGVGWGVAGLCPGPAIAALALEPASAAIFVAAMLTGFALHRYAVAPRPTIQGRKRMPS
ncbi:MAG: hypothetical protein COC10_04460 [Sphingobium sp.]|nr:MAG: hypothetical protein COC10_04460 [Sphingobium sp.]